MLWQILYPVTPPRGRGELGGRQLKQLSKSVNDLGNGQGKAFRAGITPL